MDQKFSWQDMSPSFRQVVSFAEAEAERLQDNSVRSEHFLLGLARENDSAVTVILERLGVSPEQIRSEVERLIVRTSDRIPGQDKVLTPGCMQVIELAFEESQRLGSKMIDPVHLLLGLIQDRDELAGQVLASLKVNEEDARRLVKEMQ